jgi:hypothetical protein
MKDPLPKITDSEALQYIANLKIYLLQNDAPDSAHEALRVFENELMCTENNAPDSVLEALRVFENELMGIMQN